MQLIFKDFQAKWWWFDYQQFFAGFIHKNRNFTYRRIESRRGWYGRTSWGAAARSPPSASGSFQTWAARTDSSCPRSSPPCSSSQMEREGARLPPRRGKAWVSRGCRWRHLFQLQGLPWQPTDTTQMQPHLCDPWSLPFDELKNGPEDPKTMVANWDYKKIVNKSLSLRTKAITPKTSKQLASTRWEFGRTRCALLMSSVEWRRVFIAASKVSWRGIQRLDHGMCLLVASVFNFLAGGWKNWRRFGKPSFQVRFHHKFMWTCLSTPPLSTRLQSIGKLVEF